MAWIDMREQHGVDRHENAAWHHTRRGQHGMNGNEDIDWHRQT